MNFGDQDLMYEKALATKRKRDEIIDMEQPYLCKSCQREKLPSEFVKHYMENSYVGKYQFLHECKECKRNRMIRQRTGARSTIEGALGVVYKQIIQGAKKRYLSCTISASDLIEQRHRQEGKCFYTGYDMEYELSYFKVGSQIEKSLFTVSCDRIDNTRGYENNNIVLCCSVVNRMKGSLDLKMFKELCSIVAYYS